MGRCTCRKECTAASLPVLKEFCRPVLETSINSLAHLSFGFCRKAQGLTGSESYTDFLLFQEVI